ncbi:hypothetical protein MMC06_000006 [Schaereria dolodes]|nr:hypothetical protein [Schaereria dolodes]
MKVCNEAAYRVQDIPEKGKGWVAERDIVRGDRLLREECLFVIPALGLTKMEMNDQLWLYLKENSAEHQRMFLRLSNAFPGDKAIFMNVLTTNAIIHCGTYFVAPMVARLNHDCHPNACATVNIQTRRVTVHSIRQIKKGEEITITYIEHTLPLTDRQEFLSKFYNFNCNCSLCRLEDDAEGPKKLLEEKLFRWHQAFGDQDFSKPIWISDRARMKIHELRMILQEQDFIVDNPEACLVAAEKLFRLLRAEIAPAPVFAHFFAQAFKLVILHGDLARGRKFAELAHRYLLVIQGEDGIEAGIWKVYQEDPSQWPGPVVSEKWKTAVEDGPGDVGQKERAHWLWRKNECGDTESSGSETDTAEE